MGILPVKGQKAYPQAFFSSKLVRRTPSCRLVKQLSRLLHIYEHCPYCSLEEILSTKGIVELAGDEGDPVIFFGLEGGVYIVDSNNL